MKENTINYYFVVQNKNYAEEKALGIIKASTAKHHERMWEPQKGDIIIHYYKQRIRAISTVTKPCIVENDTTIIEVNKYNEDIPRITLKEIREKIHKKDVNFEDQPFSFKKNKKDEIFGANEIGYIFNFSKNLFEKLFGPDYDPTKTPSKITDKKEELAKEPLNQILYGPPGTGKTYNTVVKAMEIINGEKYENVTPDVYSKLKEKFNDLLGSRIEFITFHQSYSYEEFVEGIKPYIPQEIWAKTDKTLNQKDLPDVKYIGKKGIFRRICDSAKGDFSFEVLYDLFKEKYPKGSSLKTIADQTIFKIIEYTKNGLKIDKNTSNNRINKSTLKKFYDMHKEKPFEKQDDLRKAKSGLSDSGKPSYIFAIIKNLEEIEKNIQNQKPYVLIIDEINRGNISKIFGELITLIEEDKREGEDNALTVTLPYSNQQFSVPNNLYIIGTMNTADRSIAFLDTALRRRFEFEEMPPRPELLDKEAKFIVDGAEKTLDLENLLTNLNENIKTAGKDKNYFIGHAFLINVGNDTEKLRRAFLHKIYPLLEEYFYGEEETIKTVLGKPDIKWDELYNENSKGWFEILEGLQK